LSKDIAEATNRLGLGTLHEVNKSHPRDWENPGRVRVQWKKDGILVNPNIKTSQSFFLSSCRYLNIRTDAEKQLLEMICMQIQHLKPENVPRPPYNTSSSNPNPTASSASSNSNPTSSSNKGKQPATAKSKSPIAPQPKQAGGRRLPVPPEPHPPLASRVSPYSPALSTGVLIETVKAGMNAQESNQGAVGGPGGAGVPNIPSKGKRKVVRVRG